MRCARASTLQVFTTLLSYNRFIFSPMCFAYSNTSYVVKKVDQFLCYNLNSRGMQSPLNTCEQDITTSLGIGLVDKMWLFL